MLTQLSWFQRANLIAKPSVFHFGKPGLGNATAVHRMATGLAGYGVLPLVLGDLLPDDVDVVAALGGLAVSAAAARLTGTARAVVLADAHGCRATLRMATWVPPAVTVADDGDCLSLQPLASFISIAKSVLKVKVLIVHALTNPYTPNAGAEPQAVVGRDDQLDSFDLLLARIERGRTEQPMLITGLRGVGRRCCSVSSAPSP